MYTVSVIKERSNLKNTAHVLAHNLRGCRSPEASTWFVPSDLRGYAQFFCKMPQSRTPDRPSANLPEPVSLQPGTEATCPGERLVAKLCPRPALQWGTLRVSSGGRTETAAGKWGKECL